MWNLDRFHFYFSIFLTNNLREKQPGKLNNKKQRKCCFVWKIHLKFNGMRDFFLIHMEKLIFFFFSIQCFNQNKSKGKCLINCSITWFYCWQLFKIFKTTKQRAWKFFREINWLTFECNLNWFIRIYQHISNDKRMMNEHQSLSSNLWWIFIHMFIIQEEFSSILKLNLKNNKLNNFWSFKLWPEIIYEFEKKKEKWNKEIKSWKAWKIILKY